MMNVDNDNVEPVTDLQLALAYRNPFGTRRLSNLGVGAGANAASRVDLDFVAAAPLSELVWSPHNGLSLKCADFRFFEKKSSLPWDVGPSNMVLSPPQGTTSKVPSREEPRDEGNLITSQVAFHVASVIDEGPSSVRSPRSIGYNASRTTDNIQKMNTVWKIRKQILQYSKPMMQRPNIIQNEPLDEINEVKVGLDIPVPNLTSPGRRREDLLVDIEEEHKNKMKIDGPTTGMLLEKLELSAENELQLLIVKDKSAALEAPPNNSKTGLNRRKHKEKAFSDEVVNERTLKDEDDEDGSHESVESCNSAGPAVLFSTGKKRWGFEQLTVESKRVKKQIREGPSTRFIRQDSSFVNWISNMVKGLNKTNQDEVPSLALTLSRPDHEAESGDQKIITYSRNNDPGSMNMGFQTIFQSLYSLNPNEQERKMSIGNSPIRVSKKVVLDNKLSGAYITPMSCYGDFDEFCKQTVLPKEKFNESKSGNEAGPSVKPNTLAANNITSSCSDQNKTSRKLACTSVKDGRNSSTFREKFRFQGYSTEGPVNVVVKELHNYAPNSQASFGFGRIHEHSDQKSTCKLNPIVPSPKSNNSEAMASVFAKRLDALKHIIPSDDIDNTSHTRATCFYCGKSGHNLLHCSEIEEIERENLIRNLISYDGAEESPCLCIRCFQLDHWAISCAKETKQAHCEVDDENTNSDGKYSQKGTGNIASSSGENVLKEKKIAPSSKLVDEKMDEFPNFIIASRWFFPYACGLGKWEEGLGETGYYVACITGEQREKPPQGSKKTLSVNIGDTRCLVESKYISNQDFLQDELMVWWRATVRSGGEDPIRRPFEIEIRRETKVRLLEA
ncbi:zinc knuckle (CCHC-type) family protein [Actinidia rufa]|uniref:Zinc knuckle (CCHC-type) family protein n=1 Tax=Actinidia rufa TaxID=165716 RepID=A0A7J0EF66_9ERIC|nr:zinc knuckle (CCHC-type) family protein [Actinidia rufa]